MSEPDTMSAKVLDKLNTPVGLGVLSALALFVMIPVIQAVSTGLKDPTRLAEMSFVIPPPPVMEYDEPPPPKKEEKRDELEMDKEPPKLSLDQLEMALNPGFSTDSMAGFSMDLGLDDMMTDVTEMIFEIEDVEEKPRPVRQIEPVYPAELKRRKIGGRVDIEFIVDQQGNVLNPKVTRTDHPDFDRPALDAIRRWKFTPGKQGGKAVKVRVRAPLVFTPR